MLNYKQYEPYGETMLDTFGLTRQSYIGKEKEPENNLGDHGVRKYDYETGRFNSIDPLFEKYYGWSPYQYSMNNPIWAKDWNGKEPISAVAGTGAGLYIGGVVAIGVAGWAYTEATNPGTTKGLLNAVNISFSNALYDINSLLESGSVTQSRSEGNSFVSDATSVNVIYNPTKEMDSTKPMEASKSQSKEKSKEKVEESDKSEHRKNVREYNRNTHEKGQKRKRQKNIDKKRQHDNWEQNPNKR
jgi:RHS repeat-associated protein